MTDRAVLDDAGGEPGLDPRSGREGVCRGEVETDKVGGLPVADEAEMERICDEGVPDLDQSSVLTGEAFLWSIVDAAPDGILVMGADGRIHWANNQIQELFGYPRREVINRPVEDLIPAGLLEAHRPDRQDAPTVREMKVCAELRARRADGSEFPVESCLSPIRVGDSFMVVAAIRDITARLEIERELRDRGLALAQFERALAVSDDRERIARDLHDSVIQRLFATGLALQGTVNLADGIVAERLESMTDALDDIIREVRSVIFSLETRQTAPLLSPRPM